MIAKKPTFTKDHHFQVICSALQWRSDEEAARKQALHQEAASESAGQGRSPCNFFARTCSSHASQLTCALHYSL
jgi:hypothetical protein